MKIIKILSLICFLTIGILAQKGATISGTASINGQPYPNLTVRLIAQNSNESWTQTDTKGRYKFTNVKPGKYTITITAVMERQTDFIENPQKISIKEGQSLDFDLEITLPEGFKLREFQDSQIRTVIRETVNVSADSPQLLEEVSKTVNIISGQEMRDRADFALPETLRTIPGFRVQQLGGFGKTASIKTRGLRNQDTAILIDGIRFRDASSITGDASAFLSDFTLTSVSRIEVLRGSGSSLYGTNAVGGVVDFQTPKPASGFHGNLSGAFGELGLGRFRGNASYGTNDGKFGFNIGASRTVYTRGIDGEDDAHNTNFQTRIEYNPFENTNISARFFVSDAYVRLNSNPDTLGTLPASNAVIIEASPFVNFQPDANDPDNFQKSKFFNGQLVFTHIFNDKLVFQGFYSGLKTSRKNENGVLGIGFQSQSTSFFDGAIQTANGHFNWSPNRQNEITIGYEFEAENFYNEGFSPNPADAFFTRARQSSSTFYIQDLLQFFNNKLQIAGGFRAQFFNLDDPEFSLSNAPYNNLTLENPPTAFTFDAAASYFFDKTGTKIRAHVGNGYRVPSLYERFGTFFSSFGAPSFIALGDPDLKPERSIAFDAGIEQNLFKNRAKLTAVYFYTRLTDIIDYGSVVPVIGTTPRPFGGYINAEGGIARGAEFSGQVRAISSTDIFASYTFTNSDRRAPQVAGSGIIQTLGIPEHQFTLTATQRIKRFWANFDFLASSSYLAPIFSNANFTTYIYRFDGNRRGDLTLGYAFPFDEGKLNLRVFGTLENVFDDEYYENGFKTAGRNGRIGLAFSF